MLIDKLYADYWIDGNQYGLIDNVLVILDGSGRDMGTTYHLLNNVIIPNFQKKRILVAINQADIAMKGRHWNYAENKPDKELEWFLDEKAESVKKRLYDSTGVRVAKPVCFLQNMDIMWKSYWMLLSMVSPRKDASWYHEA